MALVKFDNSTFGQLTMQEFMPGYNNLGADDVGETDLIRFISLISEDLIGELDESNLLTVVADEMGIATKIYGPTIFQTTEGEMVIHVGRNNFKVHQEKSDFGRFRCGKLYGDISSSETASQVKIKDSNGVEREVDSWKSWIDFINPEDDENDMTAFQVGVRWELEKEVTPAKVRMRLGKDASIAEWLRTTPGSGARGEALKMQDWADRSGIPIPITVKVDEIRSIDGKYGTSYILKLETGDEVWSRGNVDGQLQTGYTLKPDIPCYLIISEVTRRGTKAYVNCTLREKRGEQSAPTPAVPVKEVVAVGAGVTEEKPADHDDIPF